MAVAARGQAASVHPAGREAHLREAAQAAARTLARDAAQRERLGAPPRAEIALLREAGLLTANIPVASGGAGLDWSAAMRLVRIIAGADASLAQLLGYHYLIVQTPLRRGTVAQARRHLAETVHGGLYWAGAVNPRDPAPVLTADGGDFLLTGSHSFATGAAVADRIIVRAVVDGQFVQAVVPADRKGLRHHGDWDTFGQRLTESGAISFDAVRVARDDILGGYPPWPPQALPPSSTLLTPMMQLVFVNFYLGAAEGALDAALEYVRTTTRPWQTAGVESATQDPYILEHAGMLIAELKASLALAEQAGAAVDAAAALGEVLTAERRAEVAATVYASKVNASRVALEVSSRVFELMGARSTANRYGFDRRWRDIRVHTLHDPAAYKAREVGNYAINGRITPDPLYT